VPGAPDPSAAAQAPAPHSPELFDVADAVVIKDGNLFVVSRRDGSMPFGGEHAFGIYHNDSRFLRGHELAVAGRHPRMLIASADAGAASVHELTNPEAGELPHQTLQIRLERAVVGTHAVEEQLTVRSYHRESAEVAVTLRLAADFQPMMAIRGMVPLYRPAGVEAVPTGAGLAFSAHGRDGYWRQLAVSADPAPDAVEPGELTFVLSLAPGESRALALLYEVSESHRRRALDARPRRQVTQAVHRSGNRWLAQRTRVASSEQLFDRVLRRSLLDLRLLRSRAWGQHYASAGIPWYATLFGRDSLITALEVLAFDPHVAEETLRLLARLIGRTVDEAREEEPGRIVHEVRGGEVARLRLTPFTRYYGTVDATPLFLCLLSEYVDWAGDLRLFRELRGEVLAALEWMVRFGDLDGDGLLEYRRRSPGGLENQGWKDSDEGIVDDRAAALVPPVAVVEAQGYVVRANRCLSRLFELAGDGRRAERLRREAAALEGRLESFWLADRHHYALALDGSKRPSRLLASNQGHLLWASAVPPARARLVRRVLMGEAMFSGWGIRTLAEGERPYNPVGYHTGSVWPHDNALIALGLRKYGFDADFVRVFDGMLDAASRFAEYRLPELFAGFSRTEYEAPVPYPVACRPQAWAAGAIPAMLVAGLGLVPDGLQRRLRIVRPTLPSWLDRVELSHLRLGGARIDLRFERAGSSVTLTDAEVEGDIEVVLELGSRFAPRGQGPARPSG
jgi:glycogen debranching enzyme